MTIEELREMRGAIGTLAYWNGETAEPLTPNNGLYKSLLALIDAEIARQSVTSEEGHCWYCIGIESHGIAAVKTVTDEYGYELGGYDTPYNFCPNCGRRLEGEG